MSNGECARVCVRGGTEPVCRVCVCTGALTLVGVCSQAPGTDRNTNVTPAPLRVVTSVIAVHTTNRV